MHEQKSDLLIVLRGRESLLHGEAASGNSFCKRKHKSHTEVNKTVSTKLYRIGALAKERRKEKFTSLAHLLNVEFLKDTWTQMNRKGAMGVDSVTMQEYGEKLEVNLNQLVDRLKSNRYRAQPSRRVNIPKGNEGTRPLSIPCVEDRVLQKAVSRILQEIFDVDFLESSYGFRPGKSPHKALQVLRHQVVCGKTMWVYDVDIRGYFNNVNHRWLNRMLKERIKDPVILRLINKWLKVGVMENGVRYLSTSGTPQGSPISCILSNIYLHYVLDLWFEKIVLPRLEGEAKLLRFVDDFVICFQKLNDAKMFEKALIKRLGKFNLEISKDKTSLICFGRFAKERVGKPKTFNFLGFKHVCGSNRNGEFILVRIPSTKACSKFLKRTKEWLWRHMHYTVWQHKKHLTEMLRGFYGYFGLPHSSHKLSLVREHVQKQWRRVLMRRSQKGPCRYWSFLASREWFVLPHPKVYHPKI